MLPETIGWSKAIRNTIILGIYMISITVCICTPYYYMSSIPVTIMVKTNCWSMAVIDTIVYQSTCCMKP